MICIELYGFYVYTYNIVFIPKEVALNIIDPIISCREGRWDSSQGILYDLYVPKMVHMDLMRWG